MAKIELLGFKRTANGIVPIGKDGKMIGAKSLLQSGSISYGSQVGTLSLFNTTNGKSIYYSGALLSSLYEDDKDKQLHIKMPDVKKKKIQNKIKETNAPYMLVRVHKHKNEKGTLKDYKYLLREKATGKEQELQRKDVEDFFKNPDWDGKDRSKRLLSGVGVLVDGLVENYYAKDDTWHLRVNKNAEIVIDEKQENNNTTEPDKYVLTDVWARTIVAGAGKHKLEKYAYGLTNKRTKKSDVYTRDQLMHLCLNRVGSGSDLYDSDRIENASIQYYKNAKGSESWRIRVQESKVNWHVDELGHRSVNAVLYMCTKVYRVKVPNSKGGTTNQYVEFEIIPFSESDVESLKSGEYTVDEMFGIESMTLTGADVVALTEKAEAVVYPFYDSSKIDNLKIKNKKGKTDTERLAEIEVYKEGKMPSSSLTQYYPEVVDLDYEIWKKSHQEHVDKIEKFIKEKEDRAVSTVINWEDVKKQPLSDEEMMIKGVSFSQFWCNRKNSIHRMSTLPLDTDAIETIPVMYDIVSSEDGLNFVVKEVRQKGSMRSSSVRKFSLEGQAPNGTDEDMGHHWVRLFSCIANALNKRLVFTLGKLGEEKYVITCADMVTQKKALGNNCIYYLPVYWTEKFTVTVYAENEDKAIDIADERLISSLNHPKNKARVGVVKLDEDMVHKMKVRRITQTKPDDKWFEELGAEVDLEESKSVLSSAEIPADVFKEKDAITIKQKSDNKLKTYIVEAQVDMCGYIAVEAASDEEAYTKKAAEALADIDTSKIVGKYVLGSFERLSCTLKEDGDKYYLPVKWLERFHVTIEAEDKEKAIQIANESLITSINHPANRELRSVISLDDTMVSWMKSNNLMQVKPDENWFNQFGAEDTAKSMKELVYTDNVSVDIKTKDGDRLIRQLTDKPLQVFDASVDITRCGYAEVKAESEEEAFTDKMEEIGGSSDTSNLISRYQYGTFELKQLEDVTEKEDKSREVWDSLVGKTYDLEGFTPENLEGKELTDNDIRGLIVNSDKILDFDDIRNSSGSIEIDGIEIQRSDALRVLDMDKCVLTVNEHQYNDYLEVPCLLNMEDVLRPCCYDIVVFDKAIEFYTRYVLTKNNDEWVLADNGELIGIINNEPAHVMVQGKNLSKGFCAWLLGKKGEIQNKLKTYHDELLGALRDYVAKQLDNEITNRYLTNGIGGATVPKGWRFYEDSSGLVAVNIDVLFVEDNKFIKYDDKYNIIGFTESDNGHIIVGKEVIFKHFGGGEEVEDKQSDIEDKPISSLEDGKDRDLIALVKATSKVSLNFADLEEPVSLALNQKATAGEIIDALGLTLYGGLDTFDKEASGLEDLRQLQMILRNRPSFKVKVKEVLEANYDGKVTGFEECLNKLNYIKIEDSFSGQHVEYKRVGESGTEYVYGNPTYNMNAYFKVETTGANLVLNAENIRKEVIDFTEKVLGKPTYVNHYLKKLMNDYVSDFIKNRIEGYVDKVKARNYGGSNYGIAEMPWCMVFFDVNNAKEKSWDKLTLVDVGHMTFRAFAKGIDFKKGYGTISKFVPDNKFIYQGLDNCVQCLVKFGKGEDEAKELLLHNSTNTKDSTDDIDIFKLISETDELINFGNVKEPDGTIRIGDVRVGIVDALKALNFTNNAIHVDLDKLKEYEAANRLTKLKKVLMVYTFDTARLQKCLDFFMHSIFTYNDYNNSYTISVNDDLLTVGSDGKVEQLKVYGNQLKNGLDNWIFERCNTFLREAEENYNVLIEEYRDYMSIQLNNEATKKYKEFVDGVAVPDDGWQFFNYTNSVKDTLCAVHVTKLLAQDDYAVKYDSDNLVNKLENTPNQHIIVGKSNIIKFFGGDAMTIDKIYLDLLAKDSIVDRYNISVKELYELCGNDYNKVLAVKDYTKFKVSENSYGIDYKDGKLNKVEDSNNIKIQYSMTVEDGVEPSEFNVYAELPVQTDKKEFSRLLGKGVNDFSLYLADSYRAKEKEEGNNVSTLITRDMFDGNYPASFHVREYDKFLVPSSVDPKKVPYVKPYIDFMFRKYGGYASLNLKEEMISNGQEALFTQENLQGVYQYYGRIESKLRNLGYSVGIDNNALLVAKTVTLDNKTNTCIRFEFLIDSQGMPDMRVIVEDMRWMKSGNILPYWNAFDKEVSEALVASIQESILEKTQEEDLSVDWGDMSELDTESLGAEDESLGMSVDLGSTEDIDSGVSNEEADEDELMDLFNSLDTVDTPTISEGIDFSLSDTEDVMDLGELEDLSDEDSAEIEEYNLDTLVDAFIILMNVPLNKSGYSLDRKYIEDNKDLGVITDTSYYGKQACEVLRKFLNENPCKVQTGLNILLDNLESKETFTEAILSSEQVINELYSMYEQYGNRYITKTYKGNSGKQAVIDDSAITEVLKEMGIDKSKFSFLSGVNRV